MAVPNIVRPCLNEAVARASRLMERAIDHATARLDDEATRRTGVGDWRETQAAARELSRRRVALVDRYPRSLRTALENPEPAERPGSGMHPSSLTLVDDADVMQSIESARLAQAVSGAVDQALRELDGLMSAALGLEGIHPECNPLRVDLFTSTLRATLAIPEPEQPGWPALWMRHMAEPVAHDLVHIYRAASKLLLQAGVTTAAYRVVTAAVPLGQASRPAPLEPASRPATPSGAAPLAEGSTARTGGAIAGSIGAWLGSALQALRGPLLRDFLGGHGHAGQLPLQQPLDPGWYARVDEELASLETHREEVRYDSAAAVRDAHLPPVERPARAVGTALPLDDAQWGEYGAPRQRSLVRTRLKKQARQVAQAVGLEVVRQLLDEVAQDPRLLTPVREAIVALEPALARLTLHSPQFFGDAQHPARCLLERVAARSFRYNDEFSEPFRHFFGTVRERFNALNRLEPLEDPQPFARELATLEAGWALDDREEEAARQRMVEAVRQAEQRQQEAERIAWDLSQRSDLEGAPAVVQDFLFSHWSLVVAQARLQSPGSVDPGGFLGVVTDLLWTVKRDEALRDPARAFIAIPGVLLKVREGLDLLGRPAQETAGFFGALERLHRPVLKLRAHHRKQAFASPSLSAPADEAQLQPAAARKPQAAGALWLAPRESQACGFGDTLQDDTAANESDMPAEPVTGSLSADDADALIERLAEGCWVDLLARQQWRRARLVWTGTRRTLFMFVSEGGQPHSMTRRSLQRLVTERLLRPIEDHAVVQHAIDALSVSQRQSLAA